jgi:hypothetical protein
MIFYGWGRKSVPLAEIGVAQCSHCNETRAFRVLLNYTYMHLYWIFGLVLRRRYIVACSTCNHGFFIDKRKLNEAVPMPASNPVPFMDRWGLAMLAIAGMLAVFMYSGTR